MACWQPDGLGFNYLVNNTVPSNQNSSLFFSDKCELTAGSDEKTLCNPAGDLFFFFFLSDPAVSSHLSEKKRKGFCFDVMVPTRTNFWFEYSYFCPATSMTCCDSDEWGDHNEWHINHNVGAILCVVCCVHFFATVSLMPSDFFHLIRGALCSGTSWLFVVQSLGGSLMLSWQKIKK